MRRNALKTQGTLRLSFAPGCVSFKRCSIAIESALSHFSAARCRFATLLTRCSKWELLSFNCWHHGHLLVSPFNYCCFFFSFKRTQPFEGRAALMFCPCNSFVKNFQNESTLAYAVVLGNYKRIWAAVALFVFRCTESCLELTRNCNRLCFIGIGGSGTVLLRSDFRCLQPGMGKLWIQLGTCWTDYISCAMSTSSTERIVMCSY